MASWNAVVWTPAMDAKIRQVYESRTRYGNKKLALEFGLPPGLVSARAAKLGLPALIQNGVRTAPNHFQPGELAIIRAHLGEPAAQIRARLYFKGYSRSLASVRSAISRYRKLEGWETTVELMDERDLLTTAEVCAGLGVKESTLDFWKKRGLLKCKLISGKRAISRRALRAFLLRYPGHWDHRPADRWFLLDILCGDAAASAACQAVA